VERLKLLKIPFVLIATYDALYRELINED